MRSLSLDPWVRVRRADTQPLPNPKGERGGARGGICSSFQVRLRRMLRGDSVCGCAGACRRVLANPLRQRPPGGPSGVGSDPRFSVTRPAHRALRHAWQALLRGPPCLVPVRRGAPRLPRMPPQRHLTRRIGCERNVSPLVCTTFRLAVPAMRRRLWSALPRRRAPRTATGVARLYGRRSNGGMGPSRCALWLCVGHVH